MKVSALITSLTVLIMALLPVLVTASAENPNIDRDTFKIGIVSSEGGFVFGGFNHLAYAGFERAVHAYSFEGESRESTDLYDINDNITYFVEQGFDLIITVGYQSQQFVYEAAKNNPDIHFALIDSQPENSPDNLSSFVYRVDEAAFLSGFLAAWWANEQNTESPVTGWIGGPRSPEIEKFRVGYENGIAFFNDAHAAQVQVAGDYTSGFMQPEEGSQLATRLIENGASVIFPFAGITGYGALNAALDHNVWAIGVDSDQVYSYPAVAERLITSCVKNLDNTVYELIRTFLNNGGWNGQTVHYGTLENGDVDLSPFHHFDDKIPDSIKMELETIRTGIINGAIATGWPVDAN